MNRLFMLLMIGMTLFTAISQVLLKQSANKEHKKAIFEYLNWRVILAYFIFVIVLLVNTYAYTKVEMKYGAILDSFSYVFVLIFSHWILKEKITKGKVVGNVLIVIGIIIYVTGSI